MREREREREREIMRERERETNRAKKNVLRSDIGQSVKRLYHIILKQYCST